MIELEKVRVDFEERTILRDFSLKVNKGEKVLLRGPSGAGKSTVLRCVLGLVKPTEGSVRIDGEEINAHNVWSIRRRLAYVAQEPDMGTGTVREVIERPFEFKANHSLRGNLDRLPELLERFNLPDFLLDKDMATLSGGEKQRFALVSAILLDRPIVLLDEASAALDQENKQAVADFFHDSPHLTVLAVSHDTEWSAFATRSVFINGNGEPEEQEA